MIEHLPLHFAMSKPTIAFVTQPEYFRFTYETALDADVEVCELALVPMLLSGDFTPLFKLQADYNLIFRGEWMPAKVLEQLRGLRIALSSEPFPRLIDGRLQMTWDSLNRYLHFRAIRSLPFDYVFHYEAASLPLMARDGLNCSGSFPFPVATNVYQPSPIPHVASSPSVRWDLFFIGRSTLHRERFFGPLKHRYQFLHLCHGVWGAPLVDYVHQARICLNVHAENEVSWEPRVQMLMACGVLLISEKITPNHLLRPGQDYIEVESPQQMHEAVAYYLANPQERQRIAATGCERVRSCLDGRDSYLALLRQIQAAEVPRFSVSAPAAAFAAAGRAQSAALWIRQQWGRRRWARCKGGAR
ncbi:MAG: glycosyltransferase [Halochromatium sp.]|uniref:glycosyltransferase family protein n=1 Tax=Halochromatium sp. TaxID=2049430 RepID=UPI0039783C0E